MTGKRESTFLPQASARPMTAPKNLFSHASVYTHWTRSIFRNYGQLHTWLMLQAEHHPNEYLSDNRIIWTPILRLFKGDFLLELGANSNQKITIQFNYTFLIMKNIFLITLITTASLLFLEAFEPKLKLMSKV